MLFKKRSSDNDATDKSEIVIEERGIYVLGSGCKKCNSLEANIKSALKKLHIEENVYHITDLGVIAGFGVMSTPALVIDKKVVSYGSVLTKAECVEILLKAGR